MVMMSCIRCESLKIQEWTSQTTIRHRYRVKVNFFLLETIYVVERTCVEIQINSMSIYLLTKNLKGMSSMNLHRYFAITKIAKSILAHRWKTTLKEISRCFPNQSRRMKPVLEERFASCMSFRNSVRTVGQRA